MLFGGGQFGAGYAPGTGASKSQSNGSQNSATPAPQRVQSVQPVNRIFTIVFGAANTPQPAPGYIVPEGCTVRVRANNGTTAGNAGVVFLAEYREALTGGLGIPLAPLDDVAYPVKNLAQIWAMGAKNDGIVISVIETGFNNS